MPWLIIAMCCWEEQTVKHVLIGQNRTLSYSRKCWVTFVCSSSWVEAQQLPRHHLRPLVCEEILFSGLWRNTFFWSVTKSYFLWREKNDFFGHDFFWHRGIEVFEHMYKKLCALFILKYIASAVDFCKSFLHIFMFQYAASALDFWTKSRSWSRHGGRSQGPGPMT